MKFSANFRQNIRLYFNITSTLGSSENILKALKNRIIMRFFVYFDVGPTSDRQSSMVTSEGLEQISKSLCLCGFLLFVSDFRQIFRQNSAHRHDHVRYAEEQYADQYQRQAQQTLQKRSHLMSCQPAGYASGVQTFDGMIDS